jgi:hypothetical protein
MLLRGREFRREARQPVSRLFRDTAHSPRAAVQRLPPETGNREKAQMLAKHMAGEVAIVVGCLGLLAAACSEQKPLPTPTLIVTPEVMFPSPTPTARVEVTPTIPPTATPKPVEVSSSPVIKGEWSSRKEGFDIFFDASKAYSYVGSKADEHAHMLDLTMGTLNVGLMVTEDLIRYTLNPPNADGIVTRDPARLGTLKEKYGTTIQNNQMVVKNDQGRSVSIKDQLIIVSQAIKKNVGWAQEISMNGYGNFVVIVDESVVGGIAQVIRKSGKKDDKGNEILERYMWYNGNLVAYGEYQKAKAVTEGRVVKPDDLEFQLYSRTPLEVKEGRLLRDGKPVQLKGAVSVHFRDGPARDQAVQTLQEFKKDVDGILSLGGNYLILHLNIGPDFLARIEFKKSLLEGCKYAKDRGITVHLAPRAWGTLSDKWNPDTVAMDKLPADLLKEGWKALLSDEVYAKQLGENIDIITPTAEPAFRPDGVTYQEWPEIKKLFGEIHQIISDRTGNQKYVQAFAPPRFSAWINKNVTDDPPTGPNQIIEWHPYQGHMKNLNTTPKAELEKLQIKKIAVLVGEMGDNNSPDFIISEFQLFNSQGISYAIFPYKSSLSNIFSLVNKSGITERGYLASYSFRSGRF